MDHSDATLLEQWTRENDAHAFSEIVARHSAMVYGVCKRILRNPADAEDVAQVCFLELARTRRGVKRSLAAWLHALATSRSIDRVRSENRRKQREETYLELASSQDSAAREALWEEVDDAIACLPENMQTPVILHFLEGRTQEDVARTLSLSRATVRRRLDQGIERIRAILKQRGIIASGVALVAALESNATEIVPATLAAVLGKTALAGTGASVSAGAASTAAATGARTFASALVSAKAAAAIAAIAVVAGLIFAYGGNFAPRPSEKAIAAATPPVEALANPPEAAEPEVEVAAPPETLDTALAAAETPAMHPDPQTATLRGRVVDQNGQPVCKGHLDLMRALAPGMWEPLSAEFDESGAFCVSGLPAGTYEIEQGYYAKSESSEEYFSLKPHHVQAFELPAGGAKDDLLVTIPFSVGQKELVLRVVNESGQPIPNANLRLQYSLRTHGVQTTDSQGRTRVYNLPEGNSELYAAIWHPDYEKEMFTIPVSEEEMLLTLAARPRGALRVTVVDGRTGTPIPGAEVRNGGEWLLTEEGTYLFSDLPAIHHGVDARAAGYVGAQGYRFEVATDEVSEGILELFPPAKLRVCVNVDDSLKPFFQNGGILQLDSGYGMDAGVTASGMYHKPLLKDGLLEADSYGTLGNCRILPIGAGQPHDACLYLMARTHPDGDTEVHRYITVREVTVAEGEEASVTFTIGTGACVLRVPPVEGLRSISLARIDPLPNIVVEGAQFNGIATEDRQGISRNKNGEYVCGDLYPGQYRLHYTISDPEQGNVQGEQTIAFTRPNQEITLEWE